MQLLPRFLIGSLSGVNKFVWGCLPRKNVSHNGVSMCGLVHINVGTWESQENDKFLRAGFIDDGKLTDMDARKSSAPM